MTLLKAENLRKTYKKVKAVDGVSFHINKGEIFGLLGENGAGKTTVIKMLTTLTKPDSGEAWLTGKNIFKNKKHVRKHMAMVPQEINLDGELTVYENLYLYGRLHKVRNTADRVGEVLKMFELEEKSDSMVQKLSGGQKRRVMLARVMLGDPMLIFMDEPTIGLDPSIRKDIWGIIESIRDSGKSILLTTHYTEEAEILCDRVALMKKGRIAATGTPGSLMKQAGSYAVDLVVDGKRMTRIFAESSDINSYLEANSIESYKVRSLRLEDVVINIEKESV